MKNIRIAVRGFQSGARVFEDVVNDARSRNFEDLVKSHLARLDISKPHMIEIEFLDEPNEMERFFRFGTDPQGMVIPLAINDETLDDLFRLPNFRHEF